MKEQTGERIIGRQAKLPLSKAFEISLNSIKIRFWRSMITGAGIFLGIAFLVSVLATSLVEQHLPGIGDSAAIQAAKNRQLWLVIMSLLVCTVGITNSMLMSVTERFKEIGTMKCLGALDSFVVELFLLESGLLGIIASFMGWVVGFFSIMLIAWAGHGWKTVAAVGVGPAMLVLLKSMVIGCVLTIIATIPPAMRAAKMPPAMAIRTEI